ncbi:MAG: SDR family NAD(P)-dependent oxidoreductase, partial [Pseudomonadota bacterium]
MRNILITGASKGIGAAVARKLAGPDTRLFLNYATSGTAAQSVANEVAARGGTAVLHEADVSDEAAVVAMFQGFDAACGP